jgi:DNA-binding MarR family transcriptional regulator
MVKAANTDHPDDIEIQIFSNLRKIIKLVDIYSMRLKEKVGLSASQLSCLLVLDKAGPLSLSKLSKNVSLSPSMITGIVDQLEKKELVKRERSSSDRRVIQIQLTARGRARLTDAPLSFQEYVMEGLKRLSETEKNEINGGLQKLVSVIVSEVLLGSPILKTEETLVEVEPSVFEGSEQPVDNLKDEKPRA